MEKIVFEDDRDWWRKLRSIGKKKARIFASRSSSSSADPFIHVQARRISIEVVHCPCINTHWVAKALFSVIRFWLRVCITILLSSRNFIFVCILSRVIASPCFIASCLNVGVILPVCIRALPYDGSALAMRWRRKKNFHFNKLYAFHRSRRSFYSFSKELVGIYCVNDLSMFALP